MARYTVEIKVTIRQPDGTIVKEETTSATAEEGVLLRLPFGQMAQETVNEIMRQLGVSP